MNDDVKNEIRSVLLQLHARRRGEVIGMLEAAGLDPHDIPLHVDLRRRDGLVFLERYVRNERGLIRVDGDGYPATEDVAIGPPPQTVPAWIPQI